MNEDIGDKYAHILRKHSVDEMDIHCLSFENFQIVCRKLMTPIEIVEYLKWRLEYYQNNGDVNFELNGYMENISELTRPPFDKPVSFIKLFDAKTRTALMAAINQVRENAVQIAAS